MRADMIDHEEFRSVLGQFGSGVVVVTATISDSPVGMTCQSFISVSLAPPLVAFCPARSSKTWPDIERAGGFCVNILAVEQVDLCRQFAISGTNKFAGVGWSASPGHPPRLDGALAWIDCEIEAVTEGGDHHLVLGRVVRTERSSELADPLIYHSSRFGQFLPMKMPPPV